MFRIPLLMVFLIMLFLLITLPNTYGFILSKGNHTSFLPLWPLKLLLKIISLYTDDEGEFVKLQHFLSSNGITYLTMPLHTPQHNGVVEQWHHHVVETGLNLLHQASLPIRYWSYAFKTVVYLINHMPTHVFHNDSTYIELFCQQPNYSRLHTFGFFPWLRPYNSNKCLIRNHVFFLVTTQIKVPTCA